MLPSAQGEVVGVLVSGFSQLNTQPTYTPVYASRRTSRCTVQNSGPSGSLVLTRKALSSSTSYRFIPAHPLPPNLHPRALRELICLKKAHRESAKTAA